jgi:hypothetical protein
MSPFHKIAVVILAVTLHALDARAQGHDGHTGHHDHEGHEMHESQNEHDEHMMSSALSLSLPMTRNGSGTGWQPDASPMYAVMSHDVLGWQVMLHGSLFLRATTTNFNNADKRQGSGFDAPNFAMAMVQRQIGSDGLLSLQVMLSLDPLTVGGAGYPLLFQTGETWNGEPLVDRQHPHDLFASLAVAYTQRFSADVDASFYLGYPGEPALGPTAFMHRASSISNPDAPLGHHWLDATHISFGVGTIGLRIASFKVEGSIFTGREPNEYRYDFDRPLLDSYSWRVQWAPSRNIVAQISQGYLHQPEPTSTADVVRTTASVQAAGGSGTEWWSAILAAGHNNAGHGHEEWAVLLEGSMDLNGTLPYVRSEWVQKSWDELQLDGGEGHGEISDIVTFSAGISQRLFTFASLDLSVGAQGSVHFTSSDLTSTYGATPLSAQIYVRITPALFAQF